MKKEMSDADQLRVQLAAERKINEILKQEIGLLSFQVDKLRKHFKIIDEGLLDEILFGKEIDQ